MARNGYDRLAWCYDALASIVFGASKDRSQAVFLHRIPPGSRVLVLGGGTGKFLPQLLQLNPEVQVVYVDSSAEMIAHASRRVAHDQRVTFLCGTHEQVPPGTYNAVITPFFLDLFDTESLRGVVTDIAKRLSPASVWLVAEFKQEKAWHRIVLALMYRFFRLTTGLKTKHLPEWEAVLSGSGWRLGAMQRFYGRFVEGSVWTKGY